jgi:protein SCO1/2
VRALFACLLTLATAAPVLAQGALDQASPERRWSYEQRLGESVPLDAAFTDEEGRAARLGAYFNRGRPVVLVLVQYLCPSKCSIVLNGLTTCLRGMKGEPGTDFEVVVVSFDPREKDKAGLAAAKKASYVEEYGRAETARGWHFLTGDLPQIIKLTAAVGFNYAYSPKTDQFAHPTGVVVLTPSGKVSQYLDGLYYPRDAMEEALARAAAEGIARPTPSYSRLLILCYDFDPATGTYRFTIMSAVRLAGALTVLALVVGLATAFVRERRARRRAATKEATHDA